MAIPRGLSPVATVGPGGLGRRQPVAGAGGWGQPLEARPGDGEGGEEGGFSEILGGRHGDVDTIGRNG